MSQFMWLPDEERSLKWLTSPEETQRTCQHAYWELRRESQTQPTDIPSSAHNIQKHLDT